MRAAVKIRDEKYGIAGESTLGKHFLLEDRHRFPHLLEALLLGTTKVCPSRNHVSHTGCLNGGETRGSATQQSIFGTPQPKEQVDYFLHRTYYRGMIEPCSPVAYKLNGEKGCADPAARTTPSPSTQVGRDQTCPSFSDARECPHSRRLREHGEWMWFASPHTPPAFHFSSPMLGGLIELAAHPSFSLGLGCRSLVWGGPTGEG